MSILKSAQKALKDLKEERNRLDDQLDRVREREELFEAIIFQALRQLTPPDSDEL